MQTHHQVNDTIVGLRPVTPGLLRAEAFAREWRGMPDDMTKGRLLRLLEDVPAHIFGGQGARRHLLYSVKRHPAANFKTVKELKGSDLAVAGLAMVSTWSDADISADLDVSVRSLQRYREDAVELGWLCYVDSPDRVRFWVGPIDAPTEAYGIDLRPLIARIPELQRLASAATAERAELKKLRRLLSTRANRIKCTLPLICSDTPPTSAGTALKVITAVKRGRDVHFARMALAQADAAIAELEDLVRLHADRVSSATEESGARDRTGAQLPPTHLHQNSNCYEELGREARQERGSGQPPLPYLDVAQAADNDEDEDEEEEVVWCSDDADDVASGPYIEISLKADRPARLTQDRVNLPSDAEIILGLPKILATRDFRFERNSLFPTDAELVLAYGNGAASRCGLLNQEIRIQSAANPRAFAVAALLAEYTAGVRDPRAYLLGLCSRIQDPKIRVNLWASWKRLVREIEPLAPDCGP